MHEILARVFDKDPLPRMSPGENLRGDVPTRLRFFHLAQIAPPEH